MSFSKVFVLLATSFLLSSCSTRIHSGNVVLYDEGGRVDLYEREALEPHEIKGTAISAATLYLKTGCVYPEATLRFHAPGGVEPKYKPYWAERIASSYPEPLREWYLEDWPKTRTLKGHEAIRLGARECKTFGEPK